MPCERTMRTKRNIDEPTFDYRVTLFDKYGSYHYIISALSENYAVGVAIRKAGIAKSTITKTEVKLCGSAESQE